MQTACAQRGLTFKFRRLARLLAQGRLERRFRTQEGENHGLVDLLEGVAL